MRRRVLAAAVFAAFVGILYPYGEVAWKCRETSVNSEACVWARAYWPLSRWIEPMIVTPPVFVVILLLTQYRRRTR